MIVWFTLAWITAVAGQSTTDFHFIGWNIQPDVTSRFTAGTGWSTSGTVAGDCVPPSTCILGTSCTSGTLFRDDGSSMICTPEFQCVTWIIFETLPFGGPSATNWECRVTSAVSKVTLYRSLPTTPASVTTVFVSDETTIAPTTISSKSLNIPPPTSTKIPSNTISAAPDDTTSKAWIAGAVIGPIAGLGLCGVVCWLWIRRRKQHTRHLRMVREARSQIYDTQQVEKQGGKTRVASLSMLHADSVLRKAELPG